MKKRTLYILHIAFIATLIFTFPAFAGSLESTQLVTGTKNLLRDVAAVLTGLVALATAAISAKNIVTWQTAADEEKPKHKKALIQTLELGILGTCIGGVITAVLSYYGG
ncbi:hypothetical protein [Lacrimispora amygdalina]|uniref:hypothetical protein n=1 Tax=Lacrimispora amygdalina TaxID=253257 RepID=UPI000BE4043C|nr:hypothetical protein [Lacrimispora amygdalina]